MWKVPICDMKKNEIIPIKRIPINKEEMSELGWEQPDFILISGDAYVDHPSFGTAIISRVLQDKGYKVAILAQPDYKKVDDFQQFGRPRLGFLINSGVVDSMVNNYSVFKRRRRKDVYSPEGESGKRPDRAVIVYSNKAKEAYKGCPVIIGGIEASLRRLGHYDYWDNKIRRSILLDSKADLLIYGMGEKAIVEIADALNSGFKVRDITWVQGCVVRIGKDEALAHGEDTIMLPDFTEINNKCKYAESFKIQYENGENGTKALIEPYNGEVFLRQNPPQPALSEKELDYVYDLPYTYSSHPSYNHIPALDEVQFSITMNRGCFGECSFCAITYHQGRQVTSRSRESIVKEAKRHVSSSVFKGYIHDIGGPTANFTHTACKKQIDAGTCNYKSCYSCPNLDVNHDKFMGVLREVRSIPKIKKVFVRSGIRYDYLLRDSNKKALIEEICEHHVSGLLKVAPEHSEKEVLKAMNKPEIEIYDEFKEEFDRANIKLKKEQYIIPYFISSHPGSTLKDALNLALYLKKNGFIPDQVQDFYPTPGTLATAMYYTEINPLTGEDIFVEKTREGKEMQRALLHFHKSENRDLVKKALRLLDREDLMRELLGGN